MRALSITGLRLRHRRRPVVRSRIVWSSSLVGILDDELEEEAIELRLGQRVGAFHLERVLRREHEERLLELVGLLRDGDRALAHRLEQRRLRLRRRAVDLVGEHDVREDRALLELEALAARRPRR